MNFFSNAREGKNQWWRYLLLLVLVVLATNIAVAIAIAVELLYHLWRPSLRSEVLFSNSIPGFIFQMLTFGIMLGFLYWFFKFFHKRQRKTLISGQKRFRSKYFLYGTLSYMVIMVTLSVLGVVLSPENYNFTYSGLDFFVLLLLCLVLLVFQTGMEELLMRSYLMQGFALCTKSKVWALIITSVIFGILHAPNTEVVDNGILQTVPLFILTGMTLGFFTIITDGVEFSWGMHYANNFCVFVLFGSKYNSELINIPPLFTMKELKISWEDYLIELIIPLITFLICRKKFGWDIKKAFNNDDLKTTPLPPTENDITA